MKTAGIIGGLGPETTAEFYLAVMSGCRQINHQHRPAILTLSVPLSYDLEEAALVRGAHVERLLPLLTESARHLQAGGAEFLVMPCNTLHRFIGEIRSAVDIPVFSVVDGVRDLLRARNVSEVGLIATALTVEAGFYQDALAAENIRCSVPDEFQQARLGRLIHGLVTNRYANHQRQELIEIINELERQGINAILLACTDLQALVPHHPRMHIFDTMQILADMTIAAICEVATERHI